MNKYGVSTILCRYQFFVKRELSAWMRNPKSESVGFDAKAIMKCLPQGLLFTY